MKKFFVGLALTAMLVGCQGFSTKQNVAVSCVSASAALDTLVAAKQMGKITNSQLSNAIEIYEKGVVPVCVPVAENMSAVQKATLAAALAELTARARYTK